MVHAVGNLHLFKAPDDFNGYGYFNVLMYWTGFGFQANTVEEYVLMCALLQHLRGFEANLGSEVVLWLMRGQLKLAITGVDVRFLF